MKLLARYKRWLPILLLAAIAVQLAVIGLHQYRYFFHSAYFDSDAAAELLLARHMVEEGGFLVSRDWFYSTEVRVFHNHLLMIPLYWLTGSLRLTAAGGSVVMAALLAAAMYFCVRGAALSRTLSLAAALLCILPLGVGTHESYYSVFIANAYYGFFMLNTLLWLGLYLRWQCAKSRWKSTLLAVLCALALLWGATGVRYLLVLALPFAVYALWWQLLCESRQGGGLPKHLRALAPALAICLCWGVGYLVFRGAVGPVSGAFQQSIAITEDLPGGVLGWLAGVFSFTGFYYSGGDALSLLGLLNLVQLAFGLIAIFCAALLLHNLKSLAPGLQTYVLFAWSLFFVNSMVYLFTRNDGFARYLWLGMLLFIPMPLLQVQALGRRNLARAGILVVLAGVLAAANLQLAIVRYPYQSGLVEAYYDEAYPSQYMPTYVDNRLGYLAFLRQSGYTYGWADFWDAGVSEVLLDGEIRLAGTKPGEAYSLYSWLMPKRYMDVQEYTPQFYLLSTPVYQNRLAEDLPLYGSVVYEDGAYVVIEAESLPEGY